MLDVALCFDAFDANHDGTVDRNEFDSFMSIMGVGEADLPDNSPSNSFTRVCVFPSARTVLSGCRAVFGDPQM